MSTRTCGIKLYARNNIFRKKKKITDMRFWIIYILVQVSFLWDCFRAFFKIFCRWSNMVPIIFTQPPSSFHNKKASYGPDDQTWQAHITLIKAWSRYVKIRWKLIISYDLPCFWSFLPHITLSCFLTPLQT